MYQKECSSGGERSAITARKLFELFCSEGKELYLVGGYVRDRLLGVDSRDFDFTTNALPQETISILEQDGMKAIPIGLEFGTIATFVEHDGERVQIEITTYRCRESYKKGSRHPEVAFGSSLEEDLIRRDFTVNAMAMDADGRVIDPFGGWKDLRKKLIRTPLDPNVVFREDPLRMLRAVRFMCRLGFDLEESANEAIRAGRKSILSISRERWKQEMDDILTTPDGSAVAGALQVMKNNGLLLEMIPMFGPVFSLDGSSQGPAHEKDVWEHSLDVLANLPPRSCLRWAGLLHDIGKPVSMTVGDEGSPHYFGHEKTGADIAGKVADDFRFSRKEKSCVVFLVKSHMRPLLCCADWGDQAVRKLVRHAGENLEDLLLLAEADAGTHTREYAEKGLREIGELRSRISSMKYESGQRLFPKELGSILAGRFVDDPDGGRKVGMLLGIIEEAVHNGTLPAMAETSVYLRYLRENRKS